MLTDEQILGKWLSTNLLEGLHDLTNKQNLSILLENEYNHVKKINKKDSNYNSIYIPLITRIYKSIQCKECISVLPVREIDSKAYCCNKEISLSQFKQLHLLNWNQYKKTFSEHASADEYAEKVCDLQLRIKDTIDHMIFYDLVYSDLENNYNILHLEASQKEEGLPNLDEINKAKIIIQERTGHQPNWIWSNYKNPNDIDIDVAVKLGYNDTNIDYELRFESLKWHKLTLSEDYSKQNIDIIGLKEMNRNGYSFCPLYLITLDDQENLNLIYYKEMANPNNFVIIKYH